VPFADSEELVRSSGLPASALVEVGNDPSAGRPGAAGGDAGGVQEGAVTS